MPILAREPDVYPDNLFEQEELAIDSDHRWWALYTLSRREKDLMRRLRALDVSFSCPLVENRQKSPAGRIRTSYLPLFTNYVFIYGDEYDRYNALTTNCVSRDIEVVDGEQLTCDLRQIHELISIGTAMTIESQLQAGALVRVKTGSFKGYEGVVIRREGHKRLLVSVKFLQQGASILLEDCEVQEI